MMNPTEPRQLPRIQSQRKVNTPLQTPSTREALHSRPHTNNTLKRAQSSTTMSKNVKYQSAGVVYKRKIEQLAKQNEIIEIEMKNVQQQINLYRAQGKSQFKGYDSEIKSIDDGTFRKTLNTNDENGMKKQIKLLENKLSVMRRKIDEQNQKNTNVRKQIDVTRKQIQTLKNINKKTNENLLKTREEHDYLQTIGEGLDSEIAQKNNEMHKTKVESVHKKAQIIKKYDNILKQIQKDLDDNETDKTQLPDDEGFYMTQIQATQMKGVSPHKKRIMRDIQSLQQKIKSYEQEISLVKENMGTDNTETIIDKFETGYQENYQVYKFINQQLESLKESKKQYADLQCQRQRLTIDSQKTSVKASELTAIEAQLETVRAEKNKLTSQSQGYQKMLSRLVLIMQPYLYKLNVPEMAITEGNLAYCLDKIAQFKMKTKLQRPQKTQQNQHTLDELLEAVRREQGRNDRLLNENELMEANQVSMRRKQLKKKKK